MNSVRRRLLSTAAGAVLVVTGVVALPGVAGADGPVTFTNPDGIAIPSASSTDQSGPGSPYPSNISVSGLTGQISAMTASFNGFTHSSAGDVDALLVAPSGQNIILMSDLGDPDTFTFANNATITFADGSPSLPTHGAITSGTYAPTNVNPGGTPDTFPSPAPTPSTQTTLGGAFTGLSPNGTWSLYINDDNTGDTGTLSGWSLTITTTSAAASTTTSVTSSPNPALTTQSVTDTATVTSGGSPVTSGSVTFSDGSTVIASNVALNGSGQASTSSTLSEGTHTITATYSGTADFLASNGSTSEVVDHPTTNTGTTYCNTGPITIPAVGDATPYASHITVPELSSAPIAVTASVSGLSHTSPIDIDMLLVGPGGQNVEPMSDVGGGSAVSGVNLTFADGNPSIPTTSLASGTYAPTNDTTDGADTFPSPAPAPSSATAMSTFAGVPANGTWSLYVVDDASGDSGSISGGWCVSFTLQAPTSTQLTAVPRSGAMGTAIQFTATVTSGGSPVAAGTVDFVDVTHGQHTVLDTAPLTADGTATYTTDALSAGRHRVQAEYSGATDYAASTTAHVTIVRIKPVADAGGPYRIHPGDSLTLDASGSTIDGSTSITWDVNGDGVFGDATGVNPTLTWSQLQALGIQAGQKYRVVVKVVTGGVPNNAQSRLTVLSN